METQSRNSSKINQLLHVYCLALDSKKRKLPKHSICEAIRNRNSGWRLDGVMKWFGVCDHD